MITELNDIHYHTPGCTWWLGGACSCGFSAIALRFRNQADGQFTDQDDAIQSQGGIA
jgi:hypothetical protein